MKLSEAINLGRALVDHHTGDLYLTRSEKDGLCGCALGMSLLALNHKADTYEYEPLKVWTWLSVLGYWDCPVCGPRDINSAHNMVSHVMFHVKGGKPFGKNPVSNQFEKTLTMDQLVDWVRSIEPEESESDSMGEVERVHDVTNVSR